MDEEEMKELIVESLQMNLDDWEVMPKRKGILLRSADGGEEWLIPDPVNLSDESEEDDGT